MLAEDAFRRNLNKKMKDRGISPRRLSEQTGVGLTTIYEARRGRTVPNIITVWKLANGLGVLVDDLLKGATE